MKKNSKIVSWVCSVFLILAGLIYIPSVASILLILEGIALLPISVINGLWNKLLKDKLKWIRGATVAVAFILTCMIVPLDDTSTQQQPVTAVETKETETQKNLESETVETEEAGTELNNENANVETETENEKVVVAEPGAERAYELLRQVLLSKKEVAVAQTVFTTKEELMVLYPQKDCIMAKMLFYQEEIQDMPKSQTKVEITPAEIDMAKTMIDSMTKKFDITAYHDEYQEKLRNAITTKIQGQDIVSTDTDRPNNVIDLMEALKKTVEMSKRGTA